MKMESFHYRQSFTLINEIKNLTLIIHMIYVIAIIQKDEYNTYGKCIVIHVTYSIYT